MVKDLQFSCQILFTGRMKGLTMCVAKFIQIESVNNYLF